MSAKNKKMESEDNLKAIDIKSCTCYYFNELQIEILILIIFY